MAFLLTATLPIVLFASSATDRKLEEAVRASYNYRTVLADHVSVKARDGVVTLTGTVQDNDDKALAGDTVESFPDVTRVDNKIVVKSSYPKHSDAWIAFKIRSRLRMKANVSATTTRVDVKGGIVTLTGTALNLAQKNLTGAYAKDIDNVISVTNDLVVKSLAANDRAVGATIDDASITSEVKYALLARRSTGVVRTQIETKDGVVVITGEAANAEEKSFVSKLAEEVRGVKSVSNKMTVKT